MISHHRAGWLVAVVFAGASASRACAQSIGQSAAWDALTVSPIGAFVPIGDGPTGDMAANSFGLRFSRWRYNIDDADHGVYGLTWIHSAGSRSRASVTGGFAHVSCGDCAGWAIWGADFETRVLQAERREGLHPFGATLGARVSVGGGGLRGPPHSISRSAAVEIPVAFHLEYRARRNVWASLSPGAAYGNLWGPTGSDGAVLPMLGIVAGADLTRSLGIELGGRRVFITGGPVVFGVSLVWAFH